MAATLGLVSAYPDRGAVIGPTPGSRAEEGGAVMVSLVRVRQAVHPALLASLVALILAAGAAPASAARSLPDQLPTVPVQLTFELKGLSDPDLTVRVVNETVGLSTTMTGSTVQETVFVQDPTPHIETRSVVVYRAQQTMNVLAAAANLGALPTIRRHYEVRTLTGVSTLFHATVDFSAALTVAQFEARAATFRDGIAARTIHLVNGTANSPNVGDTPGVATVGFQNRWSALYRDSFGIARIGVVSLDFTRPVVGSLVPMTQSRAKLTLDRRSAEPRFCIEADGSFRCKNRSEGGTLRHGPILLNLDGTLVINDNGDLAVLWSFFLMPEMQTGAYTVVASGKHHVGGSVPGLDAGLDLLPWQPLRFGLQVNPQS
jgi:hypothetical protein